MPKSPAGTPENSPAIHRGDHGNQTRPSLARGERRRSLRTNQARSDTERIRQHRPEPAVAVLVDRALKATVTGPSPVGRERHQG